MAKIKTYVLLPHTESDAPHYLRVSKTERVQFKKRPIDHAYGEVTFTDDKGDNRTIRLRLSANTIYLDEQVAKGMPATYNGQNGQPYKVPPTQRERDALKFTNGVLMTNMEIVQKYIEASPQFDKFTGQDRGDVKKALYACLDKDLEIKNDNAEFRKRIAAANKVMSVTELKDGQDLLIRLNGTHFKVPGIAATTQEEKEIALSEIQNMLIQFVDDADEAMLAKLMDDSVSKDEEVMLVISRAISAGILAFNKTPNQVSIFRNKEWIPVKLIDSSLPQVERERYLIEYLSSKEGEMLLNDLQNQLGGKEKTKSKRPVAEPA